MFLNFVIDFLQVCYFIAPVFLFPLSCLSHHILFIFFVSAFCFVQLFSNVAPTNTIIPTIPFYFIVVTVAILYSRNYSRVSIFI